MRQEEKKSKKKKKLFDFFLFFFFFFLCLSLEKFIFRFSRWSRIAENLRVLEKRHLVLMASIESTMGTDIVFLKYSQTKEKKIA